MKFIQSLTSQQALMSICLSLCPLLAKYEIEAESTAGFWDRSLQWQIFTLPGALP